MKYFTKSWSEYKLNEDNCVIRNEKKFGHRYLGISDFFKTKNSITINKKRFFGLFKPQYSTNYICPRDIYKLYNGGKINIKTISFEEIKNKIDGKNSLMFIDNDLEEIIMSTPIFYFENN